MDRQQSSVIIVYRNRILLGRPNNFPHYPQSVQKLRILSLMLPNVYLIRRSAGWLFAVFIFKPTENNNKSREENQNLGLPERKKLKTRNINITCNRLSCIWDGLLSDDKLLYFEICFISYINIYDKINLLWKNPNIVFFFVLLCCSIYCLCKCVLYYCHRV